MKPNVFFLSGSDKTPEVRFAPEEGTIDICGASYPENAQAFYNYLLDKIDRYAQSPPVPKTYVRFRFSYFNTGTNTPIFALFRTLEKLNQKDDHEVEIYWEFDEDDEDIKELGEYFSGMVELPFKIIEVKQ
ncbi:MAG: DUF1987 domain-containing protein [Bacteroidetes bacterium]|nr:MAG: DUF1987 domain-containing protein [Bacteroidota bacterium]TAG87859.1 MAG: DUF1987 domain-containing protein [Bacteroidota bacterium]